MAHRVSVLAFLMVFIASTLAQAQQEELPVSEVARGIFVHIGKTELMTAENDGATANIGFIIGESAVAVVDTGGSLREGKQLLAAIRARTDRPIRYVIYTHGHPDHTFGAAAFENGATEFVGHQNLPRALAARGPFYLDNFRRIMGAELMEGVRIIPPTRLVGDTITLDLGSRILTVRSWPAAHSDSDVTVFDEQSKTLLAGDLVFLAHIPVLDGSIRGWLGVLPELAAIPAARVVPGHGAVSDWPGALADQRRYLETLASDTRGLVARGAPITT